MDTADAETIATYASNPLLAAEAIRNLENQIFGIRAGLIKRVNDLEDASPGTIDVTSHADAAQGHRVTLDVTGASGDMKRLIRDMTRTGHLTPQKAPLLVFGRSVIDAGPMVDQLQRITDAEVTTISATRHPTLPLGLVDPVVIRTPEYVALPDDHEGKHALEENLRRAAASS